MSNWNALAYFDECVSLSTFDLFDFSLLEDPPVKLVGVGALDGDGISLPHANSSIPGSNSPSNYLHDKQVSFHILVFCFYVFLSLFLKPDDWTDQQIK